MLPTTPVLKVTVLCTAHTPMAITSLFTSIHWPGLCRCNHASIMFTLFRGDCDGLLTCPFPKTAHLSVRVHLDPQNRRTITLAPSEKITFRRPTREPCPTLTNFNFFPQSKMFSETENFLLNNTLYLEIKFTNLPSLEGATISISQSYSFL